MPLPADRLPTDLKSLASKVADHDRQIRELRAARTLEHASIDNGTLTARNADGSVGAALGTASGETAAYTGTTVQTADSGPRVVLTGADADGLPAAEFYSGNIGETAPGEVSARLDPTKGRPFIQMDAPTAATDISSSAFVRVYSGDQTGLEGLFEITTGHGNGFRSYITGGAASSGEQGDITLHVDDNADSYSELVVSPDLVQFQSTDALKGFTYDSSGTNDELSVTGKITGPNGQFSEEGSWVTPTYPGGGKWVATTDASYQPARYSRGSLRARLDGIVQCGTSYASGSAIAFTVPAGYRPLKAHYLSVPIITSGSPAQLGLRIDNTGNVTLYTSTTIAVGALVDLSKVDWPLD